MGVCGGEGGWEAPAGREGEGDVHYITVRLKGEPERRGKESKTCEEEHGRRRGGRVHKGLADSDKKKTVKNDK